MSDTAPPLKRNFTLFTGGENPELDRLAIVIELFCEMNVRERRSAVAYLNERFREAAKIKEGEG